MNTLEALKEKDRILSAKILDFAQKNGLATDDAWPIYDGLYSAEKYLDSPIRLMWVLKEPYDDNVDGKPVGGDWSITKDLFNEPIKWSYNKTGKMVIYATYGIFNQKKWSEMDYIYDKPEMANVIQKMSYINLSKMPAYTKSSDSALWRKYSEWRDITLEQIKLYDPDVIIFGNTLKYFEKDLEKEGIIFEKREYNDLIDIYRKDNQKLIVNTYHPGNRFSSEEMELYVNSLEELVNNWYWEKSQNLSSSEEKYSLLAKLAKFLVENRLKMTGGELAEFLNTNGYTTSYGSRFEGGRGIYTVIRNCWHYYHNRNESETEKNIENSFVNSSGYPAFW